MGQFLRRPLHRMTQSDLLNMRIAGVHRPGIHRHRIDVVKHSGVRANFGHIVADAPQVRNGAQRAHNSARAKRIGNSLLHAMQLTDFKIGDRTGLIAANLEGHHHKIRVLQRRFLVAMAADFPLRAQRVHQFAHHNMRLLQASRIDIHQGDMRGL